MVELLQRHLNLTGLLLLVFVFGFAPGIALAAIVRLIPDSERRNEIQAELYSVPRWDRPFWVGQQLEVALRIGLAPKISWWWCRAFWHRAKLESGTRLNRAHPDTFYIPSEEEKRRVGPGGLVKLDWSIRRSYGERMWVIVESRKGNKLAGRIDSFPVLAYFQHGDKVKFTLDNIVDIFDDN